MCFKTVEGRMWIVLCSEVCSDVGKMSVIVRALYSLKSAGATLRSHLASYMESVEYLSHWAYLDLWTKPETCPDNNRVQYYLYLLCHVDDVLFIHHNTNSELHYLHQSFLLKPWIQTYILVLCCKQPDA